MLTTSSSRATLFLTALALLTGLGACASNDRGTGTPPPDDPMRRLEVVGPTGLRLEEQGSQPIEVRYLEADGTRIEDGVIDFDLSGGAEGATLSTGSVRTNDVGIGRVMLQAGGPARFEIVASAEDAAPVTLEIIVDRMQFGELEYRVSYGGERFLASVEAALFTNTTCAAIDARVPSPRAVQQPRLDRTSSFDDVPLDMTVAVYALGMTTTDAVAADGCADMRFSGDEDEPLTIVMDDADNIGGVFETEEIFDLREASTTLQIVDALLGLASDPAEWIVDFVRMSDEAPEWLREALSTARNLVVSTLDALLGDVLPSDYRAEVMDVHDDFRAALAEFTMLGELEWSGPGEEDFDEFEDPTGIFWHDGYHRITRIVMPMSTTRPMEYRVNAEAELQVGLREEELILPEHALEIPLGWYVAQLLEDELLPRLPGAPTDVASFVDDQFDCREIAASVGSDSTTSEDLALDACEFGKEILTGTLEGYIEDLSEDGTLYLESTATIVDSDRDYVTDRIEEGVHAARWVSETGEYEFPGTFTGERSDGKSGYDHPVLRRIRELL
jgi:hypothetical protein